MDPEDVEAYRAMTLQERLTRSLEFTGRIRAFKIECARTHHPGWGEEKVMNEVRRWVRNGMNPVELYEWWPPED